MRICIISDGLPYQHGGAQLRAYRHTSLLRESATPAFIIAWDRGIKRKNTPDLPDYVYPIKLTLNEKYQSINLFNVLHSGLLLAEITARLGLLLTRLRSEYDLLHVINTASLFCLSTVIWGKILHKPVILEPVSLGADDPITLGKRQHLSGKQIFPHKPLKLSLFLAADEYVCKSPALMRACKSSGITDRKLFLIPSGIDASLFSPPSENQKLALRKNLGLPPNKIIILFVGGMDEKKGIRELLEAFHRITNIHPDIHMLVLGECQRNQATYQSILSLIQEWQIDDRVTLTGDIVNNIHEYMQVSDIFIHPSWREGFSMAILEAMSVGLPVIASDIPSISETQINNGINGILVPVRDPDSIINALEYLLDNVERRSKLGRAARSRVLNEFTTSHMLSNYIQLYQHALKN